MELGGFADYLDNYSDRELNAFNYCTAENYINAFYLEDFEAIGKIDETFFRDICYWYNYEEGLNHQKTVNELKNGTFKTFKNRTIIDAIYENKNVCLAEIYVNEKIYSPKLIMICLLYGCYKINIFPYDGSDKSCNKIFKELFDFIDLGLNNVEDKKEYLKKIKENIKRIRYGNPNTNKYINDISNNYEFIKQIRKEV